MTSPKVSIIVPNFNHSLFLEQRLESVFNQTFQDFEVILLDDCSTDNSVEILKKYANHAKTSCFIVNDTNSGSTFRQWKKGIEIAKGEYIWIAESDDFCELSFLDNLVGKVEKNPSVVIVASNLVKIDKNGNLLTSGTDYKDKVFDGRKACITQFTRGNYLWNSSALLLRKKTLQSVDWKEIAGLHFCGDWFLYVHMLRRGSLQTVHECLSYFRTHENTVSESDEAKTLFLFEGLEIVNTILTIYPQNWFVRYYIALKWAKIFKETSGLSLKEREQIEKLFMTIFKISLDIIVFSYLIGKLFNNLRRYFISLFL